MAGKEFNPCDVSEYATYFPNDREGNKCQSDFQDDVYGEYIAIYGHEFDFYLVERFIGENVFGEDATKKYCDISFAIRATFEPTGQTKEMGMHDVTAQNDAILLNVHKSTARCNILQNLMDNEIVPPATILDYNDFTGLNDQEKWRRDLQEGDCFLCRFNGIVYEIDGVVEEPEYQHMLHKYIYQVHARPKLMSSEDTGDAMPVDEQLQDKIDKNQGELDIEGDVILF